MSSLPATTPFPERLRRLAETRGLSVERVLLEAWNRDVKGTNPNTLKKVMRGERPLQLVQLEAVAAVLGVPADEFPEYRLALARRLYDERQVGLEQALANLSRLDEALELAASLAVADAAAPASRRSQRDEPGGDESRRKGRGE